MKILLINPPRENEIIGNNPSIIEKERGFNPPLGLLYLGSYLEKYSKHDVTILDCQVEKIRYPSLFSRVQTINPDVVGVTSMTLTLLDVVKTLAQVKKANKDIITVLGGPHVNLFPQETIELKNVDYLVLGEGEYVFRELLDRIRKKEELLNIPGLVFKYKGKIINTGARPLITDLDKLPFPARHMVPYKKYTSLLAKGNIVTTIITSRGCPYKCTFCDRPHLGKTFRARSAKNIVDELEECKRMGIDEFLFYDDTFALNKKRVIDVCNELIRRKLKIGWDIRTRVDTVDEEIIAHLKKAGCQGIHYGIEAGSEAILRVLNKNITMKQAKQAFYLTRKYKIPILAYFMIGNPGETLADIEKTFFTMNELKPDYAHITILTPFPGTKIYSDGMSKGIIKRDYWKEFSKNPTSDFIPPHWNEIFTRNELNKILIGGYRHFYLRPMYILRTLLKLKNLSEVLKKIKAGIKLIFMK